MDSGFLGILFIGFVIFIVIYLFSVINILREYERAVIFRLGKLYPNPKGPGVILVFRPFHKMVRVSLRHEAMEGPAQDISPPDTVTLKRNDVITLRVSHPNRPVLQVAH